ncbi:MAG: hypothetical protein RMK62_05210 [Armatimonadota bacterium]|nr:hypothetical protein [Armatimonadota bacterium]
MRREIPVPLFLTVVVLIVLIAGLIFWRIVARPTEVELTPERMPAPLKEMMGPAPRQSP